MRFRPATDCASHRCLEQIMTAKREVSRPKQWHSFALWVGNGKKEKEKKTMCFPVAVREWTYNVWKTFSYPASKEEIGLAETSSPHTPCLSHQPYFCGNTAITVSQLKPVGGQSMRWIKTNILNPLIKIPRTEKELLDWEMLRMHEAKSDIFY